MPQISHASLAHHADAHRVTASAAASMDSMALSAPVDFYYGYWFSHWRA
jgi:hypothetical protein